MLKDFATRQQVDQQHALVEQYRAQVDNDEAQIDYARNPARLHDDPRADRAAAPASVRSTRAISSTAGDHATIVVITQLQPISVVFTLAAGASAQTKLTLGQVTVPVTCARAGQPDEARPRRRSIWSTTRSTRRPARSS